MLYGCLLLEGNLIYIYIAFYAQEFQEDLENSSLKSNTVNVVTQDYQWAQKKLSNSIEDETWLLSFIRPFKSSPLSKFFLHRTTRGLLKKI